MTFRRVADQARDIITRMVAAGLAVRQFYPTESTTHGARTIGDLSGVSIALRNISYDVLYRDLDQNDSYHVKLPDGGLLTFQYAFDTNDVLQKHRLAFFPPNSLPTVEEAPLLYENDELYGDIILNRLVRFPIRFDYDPKNAKEILHPESHLTFGQFENCRIPVSHPIDPHSFVLFILRNFYHRSYLRNRNTFDKRSVKVGFRRSIKESESRIAFLSIRPGRDVEFD